MSHKNVPLYFRL